MLIRLCKSKSADSRRKRLMPMATLTKHYACSNSANTSTSRPCWQRWKPRSSASSSRPVSRGTAPARNARSSSHASKHQAAARRRARLSRRKSRPRRRSGSLHLRCRCRQSIPSTAPLCTTTTPTSGRILTLSGTAPVKEARKRSLLMYPPHHLLILNPNPR